MPHWSYSRLKNGNTTVKPYRSSSDNDLWLVSFSTQCKTPRILFFKKHRAYELKTCHTAFNFLSKDSNNTILNFKIRSTEIRYKIFLVKSYHRAKLFDVYLQVSCEKGVTFYSSVLCIRAALAPVRLRICTGSHVPSLPVNACKWTSQISEYSSEF